MRRSVCVNIKRFSLILIVSLTAFQVQARPKHLPDLTEQTLWPDALVQKAYGHIVQGGLLMFELAPDVSLTLDGRPVPKNENWAVIGFDRDQETDAELVFESAQRREIRKLTVSAKDYKIQRIQGIPQKYVTPAPEALEKIRADGAKKREARKDVSNLLGFLDGFSWPVLGPITGVFGSQRFYNGEPRRPHYGIDVAAPTNTPVKAAAPGRVTLASSDMYFEGGLVFIDHGLGLTSIYMHLNSVDVREGEMVRAEDVIGTVGATGRVTGPHLDWRLQWMGRNLDPALLVPPMPDQ